MARMGEVWNLGQKKDESKYKFFKSGFISGKYEIPPADKQFEDEERKHFTKTQQNIIETTPSRVQQLSDETGVNTTTTSNINFDTNDEDNFI